MGGRGAFSSGIGTSNGGLDFGSGGGGHSTLLFPSRANRTYATGGDTERMMNYLTEQQTNIES